MSTPEPKAESTASPEASAGPSSTEPAEPQTPDIRDADFGNMTWIDPLLEDHPTKVKLKNNRAVVDMAKYELGEVVYTDLNADGFEDAVASLEKLDGKAYWEQYFAWIATKDGPVQVQDQIDIGHNCGSTIDKIKAVETGVEVTSYRRSQFKETSCAENGPLKDVRTVSVEQYDGDENFYLVRNKPSRAYGGYCDPEADGETIAMKIPVYAAPHEDSVIKMKPDIMFGYLTGSWESAVKTKDEKWVQTSSLEKVDDSGTLEQRCVWIPTTKNPLYTEGEPFDSGHGPVG